MMSAKIAFTLLLPKPSPRKLYLPLFGGKVPAGFPSPADDYIQKTQDLNELLVQKPASKCTNNTLLYGGLRFDVHPEGELEAALAIAVTSDQLMFIEIHTRRLDCPEALVSAGRSLAIANQLD
jgi:hypothetical protein